MIYWLIVKFYKISISVVIIGMFALLPDNNHSTFGNTL